MIDLTPLDIRKKKGDFTRALRGYEPREVDHFLDTVAERLEEVVKVNLTLRERVDRLSDRVQGQEGRERAVQEALVTAQSLKHDIQEQAKREAELIKREAESGAEGVRDKIKRIIGERRRELVELNRARSRFLKGFRSLLERELDAIEVAESNPPSDELDLDVLQFGRASTSDVEVDEAPEAVEEAGSPPGEDEPSSDEEPAAQVAHDPTEEAESSADVEITAEVASEGEEEETRGEEEAAEPTAGESAPSNRSQRTAVPTPEGEAAEGAEEERWGAR